MLSVATGAAGWEPVGPTWARGAFPSPTTHRSVDDNHPARGGRHHWLVGMDGEKTTVGLNR
jgi:hypothetical protein